MASITYLKKDDNSFSTQLTVFAGKIDEYATSFGLTTAETDSIKADAKYLAYVMVYNKNARTFTKALTAHKKLTRKGKNKNIVLELPSLPDLGTPPPSVKPNIEFRFSKLVKKIKSNVNYNASAGDILGIEAIRPHFDMQAGKPKLTYWHGEGTHPKIKYKKGKYQGAQIWKDEGNGYFLLATISQNNYVDETQLADGIQSAVWHYKAIYLYKDKQVGTWSDVITITVSRMIQG